MAEFNISHGNVDAPAFIPGSKVSVHEFIVDFDEMARRGDVPIAADTVKFMVIPRAGYVTLWHWEVSRMGVDPAAATFTIEDADGPILAATDLKTLASGVIVADKYYAAGDEIFATLVGNPTGARFKVQQVLVPFHIDDGRAVVY